MLGALKSVFAQTSLNFCGLILVCTRASGREVNNFNENNEEQFANGQVNCDCEATRTPTESATQLDTANVIEKGAKVATEELLGLMITSSGAGRATVDFRSHLNTFLHSIMDCMLILLYRSLPDQTVTTILPTCSLASR
jgi:hypothetical protein